VEIGHIIKQKNFANNFEKVQVNLIYTYNHYRIQTEQIFKPYKIQPQHFNILRIVKGKHPVAVCMADIVEVMLDKGRDVTRLVQKLVDLNLLERKISESNRRKVEITITPEGIRMTEKIKLDLKKWSDKNQKLTEAEAEQLSFLLDKMRG